MGRPAVVQMYEPPEANSFRHRDVAPTFKADRKTERSIAIEPVPRPKGYAVSWHYNPEVERYHFGPSHPMKPWRLKLTKQLILGYKMDTAMDCYISRAATKEEMAEFHKEDYLSFLQKSAVLCVSSFAPRSTTDV